jgi:hypothetical protein
MSKQLSKPNARGLYPCEKGEFGQHTKYRRLVLERNASTNAAKLLIAEEVVAGRGVGVFECWGNSIYLKEHENRHT